jgi:hypothetical protein
MKACDEVANEQVGLVTELIAAATPEEGRKVQVTMKTVRWDWPEIAFECRTCLLVYHATWVAAPSRWLTGLLF